MKSYMPEYYLGRLSDPFIAIVRVERHFVSLYEDRTSHVKIKV